MTSALFEARTDYALRKLEQLDEPTFREHIVDNILHRVFPKRALSVDDAFLRRQAFLKNGPTSGRLHSGWVVRESVTDGLVFFGQEQMTELHAAVELSTEPVQRALIMREIDLLMHRFKQCAIVYLFVHDERRIVPYCSWRTVYELDRDVSFVRAFYLNTAEELEERAVDHPIADVAQIASTNNPALGFTRDEQEFYARRPGNAWVYRHEEDEFDGTAMRFMSLYRFNATQMYARRREYMLRPGAESHKWALAIPVFHAPDEVRAHSGDIDATLAWWLREYDPFLWPHVAEMLAPTDDGHLRFSLRLVHTHSDTVRYSLFGFIPARDAPLPHELTGVVFMMPVADYSTNFQSGIQRPRATALYEISSGNASPGCNAIKEIAKYTFRGIRRLMRVYRGALMPTGWYLAIAYGDVRRNFNTYAIDRAQFTPTLLSGDFSINAIVSNATVPDDEDDDERSRPMPVVSMMKGFVNVPFVFKIDYGSGDKRSLVWPVAYVPSLTRVVADLVKDVDQDDTVQRALDKLSISGHTYDGERVVVARPRGRLDANYVTEYVDNDVAGIVRSKKDLPAAHIAFLESVFKLDIVRQYFTVLADNDAAFEGASIPDYQTFVDQVIRVVAYASSSTVPGFQWSAYASKKPSYRANMDILEDFLGEFVTRFFALRPAGIYMAQPEMDAFIDDAQVHVNGERLRAFYAQRQLKCVMDALRAANPHIHAMIDESRPTLAQQLSRYGLARFAEKYDALRRQDASTLNPALNLELANVYRQLMAMVASSDAINIVNAEMRNNVTPLVEDAVIGAIEAQYTFMLPSADDGATGRISDECMQFIRTRRFAEAALCIRAQKEPIIGKRTILALLDAVIDPNERATTVVLLTPLIRQLYLPDNTVPVDEQYGHDQLLVNVNDYFAKANWSVPNDSQWAVRVQTVPAPTAARVPTAAHVPTAARVPTAAHEGSVSERTRLRRERIRAIIDADTGAAAEAAAPVSVYADYDTLFFEFVTARQNGDIGEQFLAPLKRFSLTTPHAHRLIEDISRQCAIHELFAGDVDASLYARFLSGTEYAHRIMHTRWPVCGGVRLNESNEPNEEVDANRVRDAAYDFILRINDEIFRNTSQPRSPAARATLANNRDMLREFGFTREAEFLNDPALESDSARWRDAYMAPERLEGGMRAARACLLDEGGLDFLLLTNVIPLDTDEAALRYELIERLGGSAEQYGVYV